MAAVLSLTRDLVGMRRAVEAHTAGSRRAVGLVLGLLLAAATFWLTTVEVNDPGRTADLLALALTAWLVGWLAAPFIGGGAREPLRVEDFSLLPVPPRRLAAGLAGAALAGVGPLVTVVAFAATVVVAARSEWVAFAVPVAVAGAILQLVLAVSAAKLVRALLGAATRVRLGVEIAALQSALLLVTLAVGWVVLIVAVAWVQQADLPTTFADVVRAAPSSWSIVSTEAAGRGDWLLAIAPLGGLAVLAVSMVAGWGSLLERRLVTPAVSRRATAGFVTRKLRRWLPSTPVGAIIGKELRTWTADPRRAVELRVAVYTAAIAAVLVWIAGAPELLPWAGLVLAHTAAATSVNLYGLDGTALWYVLSTPGAERADVRGRQLAWLLLVGPLALAAVVVPALFTASSDVWPWLLALLPAMVGGGAGLVAIVSVTMLAPGPDPGRRGGDPLETGDVSGSSLLMWWVSLLALVPTAAVVFAGDQLEIAFLRWAGIPVGVATGALLAWWLGRLAVARLEQTGPELLQRMRSGPDAEVQEVTPEQPTPSGWRAQFGIPTSLPIGLALVVAACWSLFWLPLFPQGIVPAVFKLAGSEEPVWFLALHLDEPWQWPVIAAMIAIGSAMLALALLIPRRVGNAPRS